MSRRWRTNGAHAEPLGAGSGFPRRTRRRGTSRVELLDAVPVLGLVVVFRRFLVSLLFCVFLRFLVSSVFRRFRGSVLLCGFRRFLVSVHQKDERTRRPLTAEMAVRMQ